ncbi:MAG: YdeI/OmpD-associated family protein [Actinomycetota bacterium]|nr:YdeI/OmpD-associated family protein [Actinomycetota bacterium]
MAKQRFKAKLKEGTPGGGGHLVEVPKKVVEGLGGKGRIPVRVTFDGVPYRGSIIRYRGVTMLGVTKAVMAATGASVGDTLDVVAENDDAPRDVDVPKDLAKALRNERLTTAWKKLSFTRRKDFATWVADAKREETRARRIETTLALVSEGKGRDS